MHIFGDPGAVSRVDKMSVVKVYCKIETSPWALTLTEPVPEAFELPASDWPEKIFGMDVKGFQLNHSGVNKTSCVSCSFANICQQLRLCEQYPGGSEFVVLFCVHSL